MPNISNSSTFAKIRWKMKSSFAFFEYCFSLCLIGIIAFSACNNPVEVVAADPDMVMEQEEATKDSFEYAKKAPSWDTLLWSDITKLISDAKFDIKYATTDNFTGKVIYDCPACLLRREAATGLVAAAKELRALGYGLIIYDCYRPAPYQQRLWDVVPDPRYVAPPTKGSNHSRGMAIDLSLYFIQTGEELDMGTPYDFFGIEAHPGYPKLGAIPTENRQLLTAAMEQAGFEPITSEWWHYDFKGKRYDVSDFLWNCNVID